MDLFKNVFQPTIVHIGDNDEYSIKNQYLLNYNVVQIDWFVNNSLVLEDNSGILLLEYTDNKNPYSASANDAMFLLDDGDITNDKTVLDIPRVYFNINNNFVNSNNEIYTPLSVNEFIITLLQLSDVEPRGVISDFIIDDSDNKLIAGKDYFINKTFADYLISIDLGIDDEFGVPESSEDYLKIKAIRDIELPNYLNSKGEVQLPWVDLTENEVNNTDLSYYYNINKYSDYNITDDDLNTFYITFINAILEANEGKEIITTKDALYFSILKYFANGKSDDAVKLIELVLGTSYTGKQINTASSFCSCNNYINQDFTSCSDLYKNSMLEHLKNMLGDIDFYCSWLFKYDEPNSDLIDLLKYLLIKLKDKGFTIYSTLQHSCPCPNQNAEKDEKNYKIIDNYIKVLGFVNEYKLTQNTNKIKLWGSQFGDLLPKLDF